MKSILSILVAVSVLSGCCPKLDPYPSFLDVAEEVECRSGERIHWSSCEEEYCHLISDILLSPLEMEDVIEVTLLNNRRLQALYEDIGIAQADLVQACLLRNPILEFQYLYDRPFKGDKVIELGMIQNFLDILLKPLQRKMAREELERVKSVVSGEVIAAIAEAKRAFFTLQAAKRLFEIQNEMLLTSLPGQRVLCLLKYRSYGSEYFN